MATKTICDVQLTRAMADVLQGAARLIDRNGWHQGAHFPAAAAADVHRAPVCAVAAVSLAAGAHPQVEDPWATACLREFSGHILSPILDPDPAERIGQWNDVPWRTRAEVMEALMRAAAALLSRLPETAPVPTGLRPADGFTWRLASYDDTGTGRYLPEHIGTAPPWLHSTQETLAELYGEPLAAASPGRAAPLRCTVHGETCTRAAAEVHVWRDNPAAAAARYGGSR